MLFDTTLSKGLIKINSYFTYFNETPYFYSTDSNYLNDIYFELKNKTFSIQGIAMVKINNDTGIYKFDTTLKELEEEEEE